GKRPDGSRPATRLRCPKGRRKLKARLPVTDRIFRRSLPAAVAALLCVLPQAFAADLTARQVTEELYRATDAAPLDFSKRNLAARDLAGLRFRTARLAEPDLYGADLTGAALSDVDLRAAKLARIIAINARFDRANLAGASLLRPTTTTSFETVRGEAPS